MKRPKPTLAQSARDNTVMSTADLDATFCLKVTDDAMIDARICAGDIVFIREQDSVQSGEIAVISVKGTTMLKRVYCDPDKHEVILKAENPAYPPLVYRGDELEQVIIIGKAVAFQSEVK